MKSESVIVEGVVNESGTLEAHTILVKCPSKYEEAQEAGAAVPTDHYNKNSHTPELFSQAHLVWAFWSLGTEEQL